MGTADTVSPVDTAEPRPSGSTEPNVILIGMPGSGKTTIGRRVAESVGRSFIDTDDLIEADTGASLRAVLREEGREGFLRRERSAAESVRRTGAVVATGGSVVYGEKAMRALKGTGEIVYLRLGLEELLRRIGDPVERGVVTAPGQSLEALYEERCPLYERWADTTVECDGLSAAMIVFEVARRIGRDNPGR